MTSSMIILLSASAYATDWETSNITGPVAPSNTIALFNPSGQPFTQSASGFISTYATIAARDHLDSASGIAQVNGIAASYLNSASGEAQFYSLSQSFNNSVANEQQTQAIIASYYDAAGKPQIESIAAGYLGSPSGQGQIQAITANLFDVQLPGRVATKLGELLPASLEDKFDTEFPDRAESDRDTVEFIADVEQICVDVIGTTVPDMIGTRLVAFEPTVVDICEAAAIASMGGALGDAVSDTCDARIDAIVPGLVIESFLGLAPIPAWDFGSVQRISWATPTGAGTSTSTIGATSISLVPFVEETVSRTYTAASIFTQTGVSGTSTMALYDVVAGKPSVLLWTGASASVLSSGDKVFSFPAGVISPAGAVYFNAARNLVLDFGDAIVLAEQHSVAVNIRVPLGGSGRSLGQMISSPTVMGNPIGGWQSVHTYSGAFPGVLSVLTPGASSNLPLMMLDPI